MKVFEKGTSIADSFIIESSISSGGTADIYLASEKNMDSLVVLKMARSEDNNPNKEGVLLSERRIY